MNDLEFKTEQNRFNLHHLATDKFKTNLIQVFFMLPLKNEKEAAMNALIPSILERGSKNYNDNQLIKTELENLYGSNMSSNILKRGENQILRFSLEMVNEKFLTHKSNLTVDAFKLLNDIIFNPITESGKFKQKFFEQEKEILKQDILSLINDKYSFAVENCLARMCKNEKYGIYKLGTVSALAEISNQELYDHYQKIIKEAKRSLFLVGNFKSSFVENIFEETHLDSGADIYDDHTEVVYQDKEPDYYEQELKVNQARLSIGFRSGITRKDPDYYSLLVFNSLIGGSTHSRLFQEIREKRSLAYYVSSSIESTKGLLLINSGINAENHQKVIEVVEKEIKAVADGEFSQDEFLRSKKSIINHLKQDLDSNKSLSAHFLLSLVNDKEESINKTIGGVEAVSEDDIIAVAQKLKMDTIYLLKSEE
ncbi:putative Zn-dependent peptidase [Halanaerobium saccharolyticum]|uniref:Putative Zn-dependent peptidase n=1 Tax=Halanaerobium saccharolyticum TaxID=43595 RepID=A0A4R7YUJ5_9FIRM|nr:pitrilysin family protein [Halanaerobium saccharolyticum]RAK06185.1 putative Zn-dependent peptidase [Halanaerobium saccharolyticum]TDW00550.1 putative Zn-dependent peptidase [Halanaerobium saccharolyticum]TDX52215.1 putative Zn-dependent peptidase [Halanaerobium saccharolyticum]